MVEIILNNLIGRCLYFLINIIAGNYKRIWLLIQSVIHYNEDIRFSISYLYRIKIDDKYLLIKGSKIEQLQPVGGVYKVYSSFISIERMLNIIFENKQGFYEKDDLRFLVKGKNVGKVLNWFDTRKNREVTSYREFYEEIMRPEMLPIEALTSMKIEFLKQIQPKMMYSIHFGKNEILLFDIYEIQLMDEYIEMIRQYAQRDDSSIKLVDREAIEKECIDIGGKSVKIGSHSRYII